MSEGILAPRPLQHTRGRVRIGSSDPGNFPEKKTAGLYAHGLHIWYLVFVGDKPRHWEPHKPNSGRPETGPHAARVSGRPGDGRLVYNLIALAKKARCFTSLAG